MQRRGLPDNPKKNARKAARRKTTKVPGFVKFAGIVLVVGAIGYFLSETSGVAYGEDDIRVVDFSSLTSSQKRDALRDANRQRCNCGCGMTLAQCVATDSTCPIREPNIQRIKTIVQHANRP